MGEHTPSKADTKIRGQIGRIHSVEPVKEGIDTRTDDGAIEEPIVCSHYNI